jgi:alpha-tubulin suppressor-like RCC1 family protein/pimeloyl-ACP methyl ester carboxylesterase
MPTGHGCSQWSTRRALKPIAAFVAVIAVVLSVPSAYASTNQPLIVWGWNGGGQLGDGNAPTNSPSPESIPFGAAMVAAGYSHSLAITADGHLWTWGSYSLERPGLNAGVTATEAMPTQVPGFTGVLAIAAGTFHTAVLANDHTVWTWGINDNGELGNGSTRDSTTPVHVAGLQNVDAIAANYQYTLALSHGQVYAWGWNGLGQMGDGTFNNHLVPQVVPGLSNVVAITAGYGHAFAVTGDGTVWGWGFDSKGQVGVAPNASCLQSPSNGCVLTPKPIPGLQAPSAMAGGLQHSLALLSDGTVLAWGSNSSGQLGNGPGVDQPVPTPVRALTGVGSVGAGGDRSFALKWDGSVWGWGSNLNNGLGIPGGDQSVPTHIVGADGTVAVAVGHGTTAGPGGHVIALMGPPVRHAVIYIGGITSDSHDCSASSSLEDIDTWLTAYLIAHGILRDGGVYPIDGTHWTSPDRSFFSYSGVWCKTPGVTTPPISSGANGVLPHYQSSDTCNSFTDFTSYRRVFHQLIEDVFTATAGTKVTLIGHSQGGLLASNYVASDDPAFVKGHVASVVTLDSFPMGMSPFFLNIAKTWFSIQDGCPTNSENYASWLPTNPRRTAGSVHFYTLAGTTSVQKNPADPQLFSIGGDLGDETTTIDGERGHLTDGTGSSTGVSHATSYSGETGGFTGNLPVFVQREEEFISCAISAPDSTSCANNVFNVLPGQTNTYTQLVQPGLSVILFVLNWPGSTVTVTLTDPNGQLIDAGHLPAGATNVVGSTSSQYTIPNPLAGNWQVHMYGTDVAQSGEQTSLQVASTPKDVSVPTIVPHVSGTLGNGGWYRSNVSLTWDVSQSGGSGIASSNGCGPITLSTESAGNHVVCTATSGGGISGVQTLDIPIDKTSPTVTVMTPAAGAVTNQRLLLAGANDAVSGVASVQFQHSTNGSTWTNVGSPLTAAPFQLSPSVPDLPNGTELVRAVATDSAGNSATSANVSFTLAVGSASAAVQLLPQPQRLADTRTAGGPISTGSSRCFAVAGLAGIPTDAAGVVLNVTAVGYGTRGWLTVYPNSQPVPSTSSLNFDPTEYAMANGTLMRIGNSGQVCVNVGTINAAPGSAQVILDATGYLTTQGLAQLPMLTSPQRLVDTRTVGGSIASGSSRCFQVASMAGIPADAAAVVLNVTAVGYSTNGWLTVFPNGQSVPATSTLNFDHTEYAMANSTIMRIGTSGQVCVNVGTINAAPGSSQVILDVTGYLTTSALAQMPMLASPERVVDTRTGGGGPIGTGTSRCFAIAGIASIPANATGLVVNVTAVGYRAKGWLTAYPGGQAVPTTSTLNFDVGEYAMANATIVGLGGGQACINVGTIGGTPGSSHVILDVVGYLMP